MVVVDESFKSQLFDGDRKFVHGNGKVEGDGVVIVGACEKLANDDIIIEKFGKEGQYFTREQQTLAK